MQVKIDQGSEEWFELRKGKATASLFHRIYTGTAAGWERLRDDIRNGSKFTGNAATRFGNKYEPEAAFVFSSVTGLSVEDGGFFVSDENGLIGASPDGLIGDNAGIEIKCPYNPENHQKTLISNKVPDIYYPQVQGTLHITGRDIWYFVSYDPREEDIDRKIVIIEVHRDEDYISDLFRRLDTFIEFLYSFDPAEDYFAGGEIIPDFF